MLKLTEIKKNVNHKLMPNKEKNKENSKINKITQFPLLFLLILSLQAI